jgi:hypothetical protein
MTDLKRENKLTTNDSIYSRKEILIPTTVSQLQKTVELKNHQQEKEKFQLELLCEQFFEQTNCKDEDVAIKYLKQSSSNLQRAVEIYLLETQVKESVRKLRYALLFHTLLFFINELESLRTVEIASFRNPKPLIQRNS